MSKAVRFVVAAILLFTIVLLAGSQLASAGKLPLFSPPAPRGAGVSAMAADKKNPGTVKPPPVVVPPINEPGTYSAGGVCTVIVESIAEPMSLHVNLLPFSTVHNPPQEIQRYLAGVCQLTFVKRGAGVTPDVLPADAVVTICFAAIPNTTAKIYVYDDHSWFPIDTTVKDGMACASATKSGKYVLAQLPPT